MGIEWFRDLSITLMGVVTTVVFIFAAIIIYRLYQKITTTITLVQTLVKTVEGTVDTVEDAIETASRNINDTITEVKDSVMKVSKSITDTVTGVQERIKPLLPILAVIQGISKGIKSIREIFNKETNEGGQVNE